MEKYLVWIIKLSISGLLITPLLVSPQTIFPFDVGKSLWFRGLIIISTTAFSILIFKYKYEKPKIPIIVLILLVFLLINLISAISGFNFTKSFWGTWERMEGIITIFYIILMIFITTTIFKKVEDWKRLFQINFAIGFIIALLAFGQLSGLPFRFLDFLPITIMYMPLHESYPGFSNTPVSARVTSTLSNPSFLAQYLSIIVFIGFGFLFEKSIYIFKNIKNSNKHSNITRGELLYVFLLVSGITACSIVIFFTASRSSFLGLLIAILVTTPFIILKITRKSVRYSLLSVFFSTLLIVIISSLTLNLIIEWSSDRYRNRIMEQNLPESILQRITAKNINQSLFNLDRLDKYGKIFQDWETNQYQNLTLSKDQPHYLNKDGKGKVFEVRDDSSYRPLLKDTIDQLMLSLNKKQIIDCDEELIILNQIIQWYYPTEHFIGPTAFTSAKEFYYELPDGTQINLFDTGKGTGKTYHHCSPVFKTLNRIHPSLAYIFNEGFNFRHRKITYRISFDAFKDKPFLGYGAENFPSIFYKYTKGTDFKGYATNKWDRSHSRPLDILTSSGIFGFTIWIIIGIWVVLITLKNIFNNNESNFFIFIGGALIVYFGTNLVLFPTISTYIQSSLLISFLARSQLGFNKTTDKPKFLDNKSERNYSIKKIQQNMLIFILIVISIVFFYWLIVIPYSSSKHQILRNFNTDLESYSEELSKFPQMAIEGRTRLIYLILNDWDLIMNSSPSKTETISKIISVLENNAEDSLNREPNNFELNLGMWNFYIRLSNYNELFLVKAQEKAERLVSLAPTHVVAQDTMIKTALLRNDLALAKKWVLIWKRDHPLLEQIEINYWDEDIRILEDKLD